MQTILVLAAQNDIVGDVEVARAAVLGVDRAPHVLEPAVAHHQAVAAVGIPQARQDSHLAVSDGEVLDVIVVGEHGVEQTVHPAAVENGLAVARAADDDGFFRRTARGELVCAVKMQPQRLIVGQTVGFIGPRVDEDNVSGLHPRAVPETFPGAVIGFRDAHAGRFLFVPLVLGGIYVEGTAPGEGFRLGTGGHRCQVRRLPLHPVGIAQGEPALVRSARFQVEEAPREHVRGGVIDLHRFEHHFLAIQSQEGESLFPCGRPFLAVADLHGGVAVVVSRDVPFESGAEKRGRLHHEFAGGDGVDRGE